METTVQDVRFGLRLMRRPAGLSAAVILALALGIGANTAMFSVVYAVLLKPLPYREPGRLAIIWEHDPQDTLYGAASANFLDWVRQSRTMEGIAGWTSQTVTALNGDRPLPLAAGAVTPNYFDVLGTKPELGRTFVPGEGGAGRSPSRVALISDRLWEDQFGRDPNILGRILKLNRAEYSIVGVMGPDFKFMGRRLDLWIPLSLDTQDREYHYLLTIARLRDGVTMAQASSELATIEQRLAQDFPKTNRGWKASAESMADWLVQGSVRRTLWMLLASVGFVLLIACVNVAGLLLSRSAARQREIAIRSAMGARPARLMRQLLTESILYAIAGGAAGVALAWLLVKNAPKLVPAGLLPANTTIELSGEVLAFTIAVSIGTGFVFGLAPALRTRDVDLQASLKDGGRGVSAGGSGGRLRSALLVLEIALAIVLLYGAGLTLQSLRKMLQADLGFQPEHVLTLNFMPQADRYSEPARIVAFYQKVLEGASILPGVNAVALSSNLPLFNNIMRVSFEVEGSPPRDPSELPDVTYQMISPEYTKTLGIALIRGRTFESADGANSARVAMVNEAFAKRYFADTDPVGKSIRVSAPVLSESKFAPLEALRVVGVIGNVRGVGGVRQSRSERLTAPAVPEVYVPFTQSQWTAPVFLALRTSGEPGAVAAGARAAIKAADSSQTVRRVQSMEDALSDVAAEPRFRAQLMSVFSGLALMLAATGVYGVAAFLVTQRTHEFGIRMALGASRGHVVAIGLRPVIRLTMLGIAGGIAASLALGQVLKSALYGVGSVDPLVMVGTSLFLGLVSVGAGLIPAQRAAGVDPMRVLRQE